MYVKQLNLKFLGLGLVQLLFVSCLKSSFGTQGIRNVAGVSSSPSSNSSGILGGGTNAVLPAVGAAVAGTGAIVTAGPFQINGAGVIYNSDGTSGFCSFTDTDQFVYATGMQDSAGNPAYGLVASVSAMPAMTYVGKCGWGNGAANGAFVAYTQPVSEAVLFQDNFISGTTASSHLVYRSEGNANEIIRQAGPLGSGQLYFAKSSASYSALIHAAQYDGGTLRLDYIPQSDGGYVGVKVLHNGYTYQNGSAYPYPGVSVRIYSDVVVVSTDANRWISGQIIAVAPITSALGQANTIEITFHRTLGTLGIRKLNPDDSRGEFQIALPANALQASMPGGFGIFSNGSSFEIRQITFTTRTLEKCLFTKMVPTLSMIITETQ